jgi:hypothetical protein
MNNKNNPTNYRAMLEGELNGLLSRIVEIQKELAALQTKTDLADYPWTSRVVAQIYGVGIRRVQDWADQGLPCVSSGGRLYFKPQDVLEWLSKHRPHHLPT